MSKEIQKTIDSWSWFLRVREKIANEKRVYPMGETWGEIRQERMTPRARKASRYVPITD